MSNALVSPDSKRDFKAIITWWQDMAQQNGKCSLTVKRDNLVQREKANAATIIQSHYRRLVEHRNYMRITNAALVLHSFILAWLSVKKKKSRLELVARSELGSSSSRRRHLEKFGIYATLMADRHHFVNLRRSAIVIQQAVRVWLGQSHYKARTICNEADNLRTTAALTIQNFWKYYMIRRSVHGQHIAATNIQSHYRGWLMRKSFAHKKQAIIAIQSSWKGYIIKKSIRRQHLAATNIQIHYRGWLMRKNFACKKQAIRVIQNFWKNYIVNKSIQHQCVAATKIQSHYRSWLMRRSYTCKIQAVRTIQNFWKDYIVNKSIRTQHIAATKIQSQYRSWLERKSFACKKQAIRTIQRTFQCLKRRREFLMHRKENVSAIIIQSHFRGWMARREVHRQKYFFVRMQVSFFLPVPTNTMVSCCLPYIVPHGLVCSQSSGIFILLFTSGA